MNQNTINAIRTYFKELPRANKIELVSEINNYNNDLEDMAWYPMSELDDYFSGMSPICILERCYYGDFCPNHDYFHINGIGNLESTDFPEYDDNDIDEIIDVIDEIPYEFLPEDIQDIFMENEN